MLQSCSRVGAGWDFLSLFPFYKTSMLWPIPLPLLFCESCECNGKVFCKPHVNVKVLIMFNVVFFLWAFISCWGLVCITFLMHSIPQALLSPVQLNCAIRVYPSSIGWMSSDCKWQIWEYWFSQISRKFDFLWMIVPLKVIRNLCVFPECIHCNGFPAATNARMYESLCKFEVLVFEQVFGNIIRSWVLNSRLSDNPGLQSRALGSSWEGPFSCALLSATTH